MPFLRQNFLTTADRFELNELFYTNTVIVTFPRGLRASLADFSALEDVAPQTVDRVRVRPTR